MPLDFTKLEKVKTSNGKTTARCPASAETGGDAQGNHLVIFEDVRFACIKFQGDTAHRRSRKSGCDVGLEEQSTGSVTGLERRPHGTGNNVAVRAKVVSTIVP